MSGELQLYANPETDTGLTVTATLYSMAGATVQSGIACAEAGPALYIGNMPAVAAGKYGVRFFNGTTLLGTGTLLWGGTAEIDQLAEIWGMEGLDKNNPMTVTTSTRTTGSLTLAITGDGETTTTVTRQ